jgi:uncharacterized protein YjdB
MAGVGRAYAQGPAPAPPVYSQSCFTEYFTAIDASSSYSPGTFVGIHVAAGSCTGTTYHDHFTIEGLVMHRGDTVRLDVSRFTTNYTAYLSVYVDWDNDGVFNPATELAGSVMELSPTTLSTQYRFVAGCASTVGTSFHMRVMLSESIANAGAPYTANWGEAYDFSFTLVCPEAALSHVPLLCTGDTATISGWTVPCGTWTSSSPGIATVSSLGLVTGVAPGSATISYSLGGGCVGITLAEVGPLPITGPDNACAVEPYALIYPMAVPAAVGYWSSSDSSVCGTFFPSGVGTSVSALPSTTGSVTFTYHLPGGCTSSKTVVITDNATITSNISGISVLCLGTSSPYYLVPAAMWGGDWSVDNPAIATVSAPPYPGAYFCTLTPGSVGTVTLTYGYPGPHPYLSCYGTKTITIVPGSLTGPSDVCVGATMTLTAGAAGTWSSSNAKATVDAAGVVTGVNPGTATISCVMSTGCTATRVITVLPVLSITGPLSVCTGSNITLTGSAPGGTWSSLSPAIASIDVSTGVVTGVAAGVVTMVYARPGCNNAIFTITVYQTPVISGSSSVCQGSSITLSATVAGGNWTSSFPANATVGSSTGLVTGVNVGTAMITYTAVGGCVDMTTITVKISPHIGITSLSVTCGTNMAYPLSSFCLPSGGTFSSSSSSIFTVSPGPGLITGVGSGTANLVYTLSNGCLDMQPVSVSSPVISGVTSIDCPSSSTTLSCGVPGGTWSSSNTSVATVSPGGVVTAAGPAGATTISYVVSVGCKTTTNVSVLSPTISGPSSVCIGSSVTLSGSPSGGVWWGSTPGVSFSGSDVTGVSAGGLTVTYSLGTGCIGTAGFTVDAPYITGTTSVCGSPTATLSGSMPGGAWSSSDPTVAAVSGGVVTAVSYGTTTISYSVPGCGVSTIVFTVLTPSISGNYKVCGDDDYILTGYPASGGWSSSNTTLATVTSVSPSNVQVSCLTHQYGTTVISYTVGSCSTTRTMTVVAQPYMTYQDCSYTGTYCQVNFHTGSYCPWSDTHSAAPSFGAWTVDCSSVALTDLGVSGGSRSVRVENGIGCSSSGAHSCTIIPPSVGYPVFTIKYTITDGTVSCPTSRQYIIW